MTGPAQVLLFFAPLGVALAALARLGVEVRRRRRAERELAVERSFLRGILDGTTDAVFVKDLAGRYLLINSAGAELLGKTVEAVVGADDRALFSAETAEEIRARDARILRDEARWVGEEIAVANGATRTYHAMKSPLRDAEGEVVGLVGISRDITHRKSEDAARVREVLLLLELNEMLQACRGLDEAYEVLEKLVPSFFPDVAGAVCLFHPSRHAVEVRASWNFETDGAVQPIFAPEDCWALRRGQPHSVEEPTALRCRHTFGRSLPPGVAPARPAPFAKTLCLPLLAHGQVLGILHLASETDVHEDTHHRALLVGEQLSMALANLELREVLRNQSIRDPLTGLFNRRYAEATLDQETRRAAREGTSFSVLMMDVDNFKRFNDTYGHEAGDEVLRSIARLLTQQIRGSDVASRMGGEEILVLLPGAPADAACKKAEELRAAVAQLEVKFHGVNVGPVTVSIGTATYPDHADQAHALVRLADEALYCAKRAGRNRVAMGGERRTQPGFRVHRRAVAGSAGDD